MANELLEKKRFHYFSGLDYKLEAQSERQFSNALITETTIPAMDGSAKETAYLTIKFQPEVVQYKKAAGKVSGEIGKSEQKSWLPSNFRLDIAGWIAHKGH